MATVVLDGKELKLDDTSPIKIDDALDALEEVVDVLVRRVPGFTSGQSLLMIKAATELLHWMYRPNDHPRPAALMERIVSDVVSKVREEQLYAGKKKETIIQ